jgi:hypothetical protein
MKQEKSKMDLIVATIFSLGVVMMISAIVIYSRADSTTGSQALEVANKNTAQLKYLETVINGIQNSHGAIVSKIANMDQERILVGSELALVKQRCYQLKDSQISIQEKLSNKRPVIYLKEPTSVDLVGKGMGALLTPKGKKAKEMNASK